MTLEHFLASRNLSDETANMAGLYISEDEYAGWLAIPYEARNGKLLTTRYRDFEKGTYRDLDGADVHLYNPASAGPYSHNVLFCEGELDALSAIEVGWDAIAMPGATKFNHAKWRAWHHLFTGAHIIIATDADQAGETAAGMIRKMFSRATRLVLPEGEDVNSMLVKDRDALIAAIEKAAR